MQNHVLIFDFDGTIADTFQAIVTISNQLADEFQYKKMTPTEAQLLKNKTTREIISHLEIPMLKIPLIIAKAKTELFKNISSITPVLGLKDTLEKLKDRDVQLGILTSNSEENVTGFLKNHKLEVFNFIKTTSKIWSKDHHLSKIIASHNFNPGNVIYIGDEARDIVAAKRLGIKVAAVAWGYNSTQALLANKPDYLLNDPKELLSLVH